MKKKILLVLSLMLSVGLFGQQGDGGTPKGFKLDVQTLRNVETSSFSEPNIAALRAEDAEVDGKGIAPWRFGYNNETALNLNNSGTWISLPNGDKIWMLRLICENALTVNLTLAKTTIPEGNELYIYNEERDFVLGKFTAKHTYQGELGAELVPGNTAIIEYYVPKHNSTLVGHVEVAIVTHGYRTAQEFQEKAFGSSGSCNMNVNCPDGAAWVNQRNSAVMLVSGSSGFCSGALINNTFNDGKPYVLTANHCGTNPTNWIFRFNWQADGCANPGSSPSFNSLSGGVLRASRQPSDMCLVEITGGLVNNTVPESYNPFFAGWNNSNTPPTSTVSIHHPAGDIKKISFDDNPAVAVQAMGSSEPESSWQVVWDRNTTTEGGSSGSPLFDQNGRIIGQLWGGGASCTNLTAPDYYGRVHNSWEPSGSNSTNQLKHWLDPSGSGVEFIDGLNLGTPPAELDAAISSPQGLSGLLCTSTVVPEFNLTNLGSTTITSATIEYSYNGGAAQTYNWTGSLATFGSETITLPATTLADGAHTFNAQLVSVNGTTDENAMNNTVVANFSTISNAVDVFLEMQLDCYGSETSWVVRDQSNNEVFSGGPYTDNFFNPQLISEEWCMAQGCYTITINDSYGDGMAGGGWCSTTGSMYITDASGVIGMLSEADADFGSSIDISFCTNQVVGINDVETANFTIYPNPTNGLVTFSSNLIGQKNVAVINTTGQRVFETTTEEQQFEINLSNQAKGVYTIVVENQNGVFVNRIVKQ